MRKDPRVYLARILECIDAISQYTSGGKAHFVNDRMIQDAVIRNLETIGEAAKRVENAYQDTHPEIPWRGMNALRNVLIHNYEGVDIDQVWSGVEKELPPLRQILTKILPPLNQLEQEISGD